PYTYQWYLVTSDNDVGKIRNGGNEYQYTVTGVWYMMDGWQYYCVITDSAGTTVTSNRATLTVKAPPLYVYSNPPSVTCRVGDTVYFNAVVESGKGPYTYQWQYKSSGGAWADITGQQDDYITIVVNNVDFTREYRCVVTDGVGNTATTDPMRIYKK
ncbi:MAG: hypothetical protein HUJ67_00970, partial [Ruminiclostridium sp.]|nr:hypothetical protein [Ruminiclostridium sp.]